MIIRVDSLLGHESRVGINDTCRLCELKSWIDRPTCPTNLDH